MGQGIDIVRGLYSAFETGDVPGVFGIFDEAIEWHEAEHSPYADRNPYVGPDAVAEGVFARLDSDVEGFTVVPENFIDGGDTVVVEGRYRGTMRSTSAPLDAQFAHVWRVRDGKIVGFQQYTDTTQSARGAGA